MVSVSQSLDVGGNKSDGSAPRTTEVSEAIVVEENVDGRGATQLFWLEKEGEPVWRCPLDCGWKEIADSETTCLPRRKTRLVFSKLGTVSIATLSSTSRKGKGKAGAAAWKVEKVEVVDLPPEGVGEERFMGASGWAACSGA